MAAARLHTVAVGRTIVVVAGLRIAVVHAVEALGVVAIAVFIGAIRGVRTLPGIACRQARILPLQARVAAARTPVARQFGFALFPATGRILLARLQAEAIGSRVIALVVVVGLHVVAVAVFLAPILGFARGVDAFGHALARGRAGDHADRGADQRAERTEHGAGQRAGGDAARGAADADPDRMRTRRAGDGIAIEIARFVAAAHAHGNAPP